MISAQLPPGSSAMTFTSGETINFTSTTEMTFKSPTQMTFSSNVTMKFGTGIRMKFIEVVPNGRLEPCDWVIVTWPIGFLPTACSWWEVIDPATGRFLGEIHVDGSSGIDRFHIDNTLPQSFPVPPGELLAEKKIDMVEPCNYFVVHWPSDWWPAPCTWWEIIDPETGRLTGYEFHVDWTNESCEFHIGAMIPGPYYLQFPAYELAARRKIPTIAPCDYFVVTEPPDWYPAPCTWWEIIDPQGAPTGLEFHVDWTNESCEFHVDKVIPDPLGIPWFPPPITVTAEQKVVEIKPCDWYVVVNPAGFNPEPCTWWEILDPSGAPTGLEFHVDQSGNNMFHVDQVSPMSPIVIQPSYTVQVRKKVDVIQQCEWFKVVDPTHVPTPCSWWKITHPGGIGDVEFHVDMANPDGTFHVDIVEPPIRFDPPIYELTAERKIEGINPCEWFKVLTPTSWVPEPCSWWKITLPTYWADVVFHVDSNDGVIKFHIDKVEGTVTPPPAIPPWNVTAVPTEPPPLPWYMKPPYPDYAPSGMPDFDQRQGGTYLWMDPTGKWSHCGPVSVANSLWWLDSEFETNNIPPPAIIDNFPLVQAYGPWDDHDPRNAPPLVEHLAYLMDTDGLRTKIAHLGTGVKDMQAGITHYLSWSGVNPLGDVDGDGNVTINDANIVNLALNSVPGAPNWDIRADIWPVTTAYPPLADNKIDINDVALVAANMGRNGTFYEHTVMGPQEPPTWEIIVEEVRKCQDVVLLIAPWYYDGVSWYRYDEDAHYVTVAGLNATAWELVISDPIRNNAEAGGPGNVPVPHVHPPEPPCSMHNNATFVSHDMYPVALDPCPGGPLTIRGFPGGVVGPPGQGWKYQIEAAVITSPYISPVVHDVAVTHVTPLKTIVGQTMPCRINVTVENQGTATETFNVTTYATTMPPGITIEEKTIVNLLPSEIRNVTFRWNTTGVSKGNYTISAIADTVFGETDTTDNTCTDGIVKIVMIGDVDANGKVEIKDFSLMAKSYGASYPDPRYVANSDIDDNGKIEIKDFSLAAKNYGKVDP